MGENETCLCEPTDILVYTCSGGSNVGQIANQAAINLSNDVQETKFSCLAGIGGHRSGIIESAKAAKKLVAIDGCPVQCAKNTLEHAGFRADVYLVVTYLGIEKSPQLIADESDTEAVVEKLKKEIIGDEDQG